MAARIVHALQVITENDLRPRVIGVAPVAQELGDVFDILVASAEFILTARVIDPDEEGLAADIWIHGNVDASPQDWEMTRREEIFNAEETAKISG